MVELNRRNLIVLGGAAATLAACSDKAGSPSNGTDPINTAGATDYGDNPSGPGPGNLSADFYTLVILRLNAQNKFESSYGSFESPSKTDEKAVRAKLLEQLNGLVAGGDVQYLKPILSPDGKGAGYDFENWGFASSRRIYIYVDTPTLKFDKRQPLVFKSYSSYTSTEPSVAESRKINKNKTFYGAKSDDKFAKGSLLYFENYFLGPDGKPLPEKPTATDFYSMSFNLLLETARGKFVPVSFDPDGGNGVGYPPPW